MMIGFFLRRKRKKKTSRSANKIGITMSVITKGQDW
jgi:hypothetical protein